MPPPTALIIPAVKKHTATVIMAHGLGDSGAGWVSLAENWRRRQKFEEVKFIFPNAPMIPITVVCALPPLSQYHNILTAHRTSA
jgi:predicted esterase